MSDVGKTISLFDEIQLPYLFKCIFQALLKQCVLIKIDNILLTKATISFRLGESKQMIYISLVLQNMFALRTYQPYHGNLIVNIKGLFFNNNGSFSKSNNTYYSKKKNPTSTKMEKKSDEAEEVSTNYTNFINV